jgi:Acetyltransferases
MSLTIRLAALEDLQSINNLYQKVIKDLHNVKKVDIWNEFYPFCEFESDIKNKDMYLLEINNEIVGSFAIIKVDNPDCHNIAWKYPNDKFIYLERVAINPDFQGKGYSKTIMDYVINYGINNNYEVIRLTVHKDNKNAALLYKKYDFIKVEDNFYTIEDKIFYCYERRLDL